MVFNKSPSVVILSRPYTAAGSYEVPGPGHYMPEDGSKIGDK